jgi:hypothetical protein
MLTPLWPTKVMKPHIWIRWHKVTFMHLLTRLRQIILCHCRLGGGREGHDADYSVQFTTEARSHTVFRGLALMLP